MYKLLKLRDANSNIYEATNRTTIKNCSMITYKPTLIL